MCPRAVVIFHIQEEYVAQVPLAKYDDMVKTFPPDRADQQFGHSAMAIGARLAGRECPSREAAV
jgi:hypothetical protein